MTITDNKQNAAVITAFILSIIIVLIGAAGCSFKPGATSEGDEPQDRCNYVASKTALTWANSSGGRSNEYVTRKYDEVLRLCTMRPGMEINEAGLEYLTCVEEAKHGGEILSCEYKLEERLKEDKLEELYDAALPLMKDICSGKPIDTNTDPRMDEINRLESEAKALGATAEDVDAQMAKTKVTANCK